MATATSTVTVHALPIVTVNSATVCAGTAATLTAAGATTYTWSTSATTASVSATPSVSTNYTVTGTDANGCKNMATSTVTVKALPNATVTAAGNVLTAGNASATYQWINCATHTVISGQTHQSFTATVTGNYQVQLTQNGCVDTSVCHMVTITGIDQVAGNSNGVTIYPNPGSGKFNVSIQNSTAMPQNIRVINTLGAEVYNKSMNGNTVIDLSNEANGVYFVIITSQETTITKQVIKQ